MADQRAKPALVPAGLPTQVSAEVDALDPANQSLADALRRSFGVLKLLMFVLLVLYFLSGLFSLSADRNEVGVITRYGRIVDADAPNGAAVLGPGWHWSWPYPIERSEKISTSLRELPVEFMFQLTDAEKTGGITGYRFDQLSPQRDDYLITGDVNIIHASLIVKYHVKGKDEDLHDNVIHFLKNVSPQPRDEAGAHAAGRSDLDDAAYRLMENLTRDAVIEVAARREALKIRGQDQQDFLNAVGKRLVAKLAEYKAAGLPLGIAVDPDTGVLGVKKGEIEPIMPPRQAQEVFDRVQATGEQKAAAITKAFSEAQSQLVNTAGPKYDVLAKAIDAEFQAMHALSAAETAAETAPNDAAVQQLRADLQQKRQTVEQLLTQEATGSVRATIRGAEIARDRIIKEAAGDFERFDAVRPEYLHDPAIFMSRLLNETYAQALNNPKVAKILLPDDCKEWRITIPRTGRPIIQTKEEQRKAEEANRGLPRAEAVVP